MKEKNILKKIKLERGETIILHNEKDREKVFEFILKNCKGKADFVLLKELEGRTEEQILKELRLAEQCLDYKGFMCDNRQCLNAWCPLNKDFESKKEHPKD